MDSINEGKHIPEVSHHADRNNWTSINAILIIKIQVEVSYIIQSPSVIAVCIITGISWLLSLGS